MTEAEWFAATDPMPMLKFLRGKASERKLRLFAVACCRSSAEQNSPKWLRQLFNKLESCADGTQYQINLLSKFQKAVNQVNDGLDRHEYIPPGVPGRVFAMSRRERNLRLEALVLACNPNDAVRAADNTSLIIQRSLRPGDVAKRQKGFLHCIFNNLFRPVTADPDWLTSTVVALATGIYQDRAFSLMPILADALQDAGCDNDDILNHCRQPGEHVRGCWVVDLLTGRK